MIFHFSYQRNKNVNAPTTVIVNSAAGSITSTVSLSSDYMAKQLCQQAPAFFIPHAQSEAYEFPVLDIRQIKNRPTQLCAVVRMDHPQESVLRMAFHLIQRSISKHADDAIISK